MKRLWLVIASNDDRLNRALFQSLTMSADVERMSGRTSIFEGRLWSDGYCKALIKPLYEDIARKRVAKVDVSKVPYAEDTGLRIFLEEKDDGASKV